MIGNGNARGIRHVEALVCLLVVGVSSRWAGAPRGARDPQSSGLATATAQSVVEAQAQLAAAPPAGAQPYAHNCASCHQAAGQGVPGVFPPLANNQIVKGDPHYLARLVLYGLQGQVTVNGLTYNGVMPGFAGSMNDDQISQALTYIRSSWGNNAPAVSAEVVKEERAKPGTPADNYQKYPK
jgi:mono/diheme cytochrome c family protein